MLAEFNGEVLGQEELLTDLPYMAMHPHGYQAMMDIDDDDWLQDFPNAQLQEDNLPDSIPSGPKAEQAGEPTIPDNQQQPQHSKPRDALE